MKKRNLKVLRISGVVVFVLGIVLCLIQECQKLGLLGIVVGVLLLIFTNPYKEVCECPKCGTKFVSRYKNILRDFRYFAIKYSLETCPKCKQTSFCHCLWIKKGENVEMLYDENFDFLDSTGE